MSTRSGNRFTVVITARDYRAVIPFIDGHNDVLLDLHLAGAGADAFRSRDSGHIDLERARLSGFAAGFFAVFVTAETQEARDATKLPDRKPPYAQPLAPPVGFERSRQEAEAMIELLHAIDGVVVARGVADVEAALAGGPLAAILHFEGAEPVDPELEALGDFYDRGLRSIGLVWSRPNGFAEGVAFRFPSTPDTGPGLTDAGRRLVRGCNELGILVDLAHLNERGFWDAAETSEAPLVASHANAHALSANSRNLTDAQLDEVGRAGGIVGITFHAGMLGVEGGLDRTLPLDRIVDHVEYVADRIGIDHVGFGSDFDGAVVPDAVGDVSVFPRLAEALRERGYREDEVTKVAHGNWLRVLRETWR
jgi:membrane dipeptidase